MLVEPIDKALVAKLNNQWTVMLDTTSYTVTAVVASPEEQIVKAKYPVPSIGVTFLDLIYAPEREYQKIWALSSYSTVPTPHTVKERIAPVKYDYLYQITLMSYYAQHDRYLTRQILKTLPPRESIRIQDTLVSPALYWDVWCFLDDFRSVDVQGEYRIFKKIFTYRVLGWIDEATPAVKKVPSEGIIITTEVQQ